MTIPDLLANPLMKHLLGAVERGEDLGEYGRRVFVTVAQHFATDDEVLNLLADQPGGLSGARALLAEVRERDEEPPRRAKIVEYMKQQPFPIIPDLNDPTFEDPYVGLNFPPAVRERMPHFEVGDPNAR